MTDGLYYYRAPKAVLGERATPLSFDVAVYGGTPTGVAAAVAAARMGKSVVLLSFNGFVGGLTSGGFELIGSNIQWDTSFFTDDDPERRTSEQGFYRIGVQLE